MHLRLVSANIGVQSGMSVEREVQQVGWDDQPNTIERPSSDTCERRSPSQLAAERAARVEALRAHVRAGTYKLDSQTIAERMLKNTTGFF